MRCAVCGCLLATTGTTGHVLTGCVGKGQTVDVRVCDACWNVIFAGQIGGFSIGPLGGTEQ